MTQYIVQMLIFSIPSALVFSCFHSYRKKSIRALGLHSSHFRELCLLLYVMLIAGIAGLKLWPVVYVRPTSGIWGDIILCVDRPSLDYCVNLLPFGSIQDIREWTSLGTAKLPNILLNYAGNLMLFIPVGFLTSALFRSATMKRTIAVSSAIAILAELGQYFLVRYPSVDNAILNVLGAVCGYYLYLFIRQAFPHFTQLLLCQKAQSLR